MKATASRIYVYALFVLFLFFTGFKGYSNIFDSKCILFTVLGVLYLTFSCVLGISLRSLRLPEICALVYLGITALSALASPHFPETLLGVSRYEGLVTVGLYVAVFILLSQNWRADGCFPAVISAVMIAESLVVVFQRLGFNILWLYPKGTNYYIALEKYNGAFMSTVGNSDISSAFFSLMTPILWGFSLSFKKYRPLTLTAAVLSTVCLFALSVTAGTVAAVVTLAVLPIVLFPEKRRLTVTVVFILIITALLMIYFLPLSEGTLFELRSLMRGEYDPDFGSGRLHIWREVTEELRLPLGSGPDTMLREDIEPFVKTVDGRTVTRRVDVAHNDYLNILFHQGIFALAAYLGVLIPLLAGWYKNGRRNKTVALLGAGVLAYLVQVFFSYSACSSAAFFWAMLGILNAELKQNTTSCADTVFEAQHRAVETEHENF